MVSQKLTFLHVFRGYLSVPQCKTSEITYVIYVIKYVTQLRIMANVKKHTAPVAHAERWNIYIL